MGVIFILFKDIELTDKPVFDEYFNYKIYFGSECAFANMFAWRKCYHIKWLEIENCLIIKVRRDEIDFFLPPFPKNGANIDIALDLILAQIKANPACEIRGIYQDALTDISKSFWDNFELTSDRDNFDYVYNREDLAKLAGRKYHSKKNHINAFLKLYPNYQYLPLTTDLIPQCKEFLGKWFLAKGISSDHSIRCEMSAINQSLNNLEALEIQGGTIFIDGQMEAFTYGEAINKDVAIIHVEKANPAIRGLYAKINQDFCNNAWQSIKYINREEDMGLEGLRKAKESYNPVFMVEKYSAKLKGI